VTSMDCPGRTALQYVVSLQSAAGGCCGGRSRVQRSVRAAERLYGNVARIDGAWRAIVSTTTTQSDSAVKRHRHDLGRVRGARYCQRHVVRSAQP